MDLFVYCKEGDLGEERVEELRRNFGRVELIHEANFEPLLERERERERERDGFSD